MAKFYVFSGRKALWNLVILLLVIAALVYMFRVEEVVNSGEDVTTEFDQSLAQVVLVEPVTVRTVPTKFSEYKLERERMRSRQVELLQNLAYDGQTEERKAQAQLDLQAFIQRSVEKQRLRIC